MEFDLKNGPSTSHRYESSLILIELLISIFRNQSYIIYVVNAYDRAAVIYELVFPLSLFLNSVGCVSARETHPRAHMIDGQSH